MTTPDPSRSERDRQALIEFTRLLDLDDAARSQALQALAARDPALSAEVNALLAADSGQGLLDQETRLNWIQTQQAPLLQDRSGERIGPFLLLNRLGRGGMGEVYRASRDTDGFTQTVALKLLRRGMDSPEAAQRFVQERRILAGLAHAGIARLIDGGVTSEGSPWLAMELVEGVNISDWCRQQNLPWRARVALLIQVCEAVDYAHRRLIVHRDLKPSNVWINTEGQPKLLDFGIAKLLDPSTSIAETGTGQWLLSPAWAAPEQLHGGDVGLSTDVHALGLLLYELLTGTLPQQRLESNPMQLLAASREPAESMLACLRRQHTTQSSMQQRGIDVDLDTIVQKALAIEPDQRYASALALADDLQRCLEGRPIQARAPAWNYRFSKFVRRHRWAVAFAAIAVIAVFSGLFVALDQAERARQHAAAAEQAAARADQEAKRVAALNARSVKVKGFLMSIFLQEDPMRRDSRGPLSMADAFEDALQRIDSEFAEDPAMQVDLWDDFGEILANQGEFGRAQALFKKALHQAEQLYGNNDPAAAESLVNLAVVASGTGAWQEARPFIERAVAILESQPSIDATALANALSSLGSVVRESGDLPLAVKHMQRAYDLLPEGKSDPNLRNSVGYNLAVTHMDLRNDTAALPLFRGVIAATEREQGPNAAPLVIMLGAYSDALANQASLTERIQINERRLKIALENWGEQHPWSISTLTDLAWLHLRNGELDKGETMLRKAIGTYNAIGDFDNEAMAARRFLALSRMKQGDLPEAKSLLTEALRRCRAGAGGMNQFCLTVAGNLALVKAEQGDFAEALGEAEATLAQMRKAVPGASAEIAQVLEAKAVALKGMKREQDAKAALDEAIALLHADPFQDGLLQRMQHRAERWQGTATTQPGNPTSTEP